MPKLDGVHPKLAFLKWAYLII